MRLASAQRGAPMKAGDRCRKVIENQPLETGPRARSGANGSLTDSSPALRTRRRMPLDTDHRHNPERKPAPSRGLRKWLRQSAGPTGMLVAPPYPVICTPRPGSGM